MGIVIVLTSDNVLYALNEGSNDLYQIFNSENSLGSFALGDLKNDGENYIVFFEKNKVHALNYSGSYADKFPITIGTGDFTNSPIIADMNSDNISDIISVTENGDIFAVSGLTTELIDGFPISTGGMFSGSIDAAKRESEIILTSVTEKNEIYSWNINTLGEINWVGKLGNHHNNPYLSAADDKNFVSQFFPLNRTYNWPNPVYDNKTNIRTYVAEDADVTVKVFDIAGDLVDEFEFFAQGGLDTEYSWNVSNIQSGAYFAHLEVKTNNGKTESKIIKIAIVK